MALVNRGFLHYKDMKKFLKKSSQKPLVRFRIISQESGFDLSVRPDCRIWTVIATGNIPSTFVSPLASKILGSLLSVWVFIPDTVVFYLYDLISNWILNCLQNSFKKKNDPSKNMAFMEDSFSSYDIN